MPALPNSNANCNSFSTGVTEVAFTDTSSSLATPLLLLTLFNILYLLGPPIFSWRFPCQSTDELDTFVSKLEALIQNNSSMVRDVLGDSEEELTASLEVYVPTFLFSFVHSRTDNQTLAVRYIDRLSNKAYELGILASREPSRANPLVWAKFQWSLLKDVDACYHSLKWLKGQVEAKIHDGRTD
ncbi:hypothetical protein WG66_012964 [Moniliophthora roreri]|nr:hypothetical protein WG66_012964 [Moniliophthora roreri]